MNVDNQFQVWWLKNTGLHTEYPGPREIAEIAWNAAKSEDMREKALRDIKSVHSRWYRGVVTAEEAVIEMEAIAVSVWQRESL